MRTEAGAATVETWRKLMYSLAWGMDCRSQKNGREYQLSECDEE